MTNDEARDAAQAAIYDTLSGRGGYYSGPGTPVYLSVGRALSDALKGN